jgi:hypothetical protein
MRGHEIAHLAHMAMEHSGKLKHAAPKAPKVPFSTVAKGVGKSLVRGAGIGTVLGATSSAVSGYARGGARGAFRDAVGFVSAGATNGLIAGPKETTVHSGVRGRFDKQAQAREKTAGIAASAGANMMAASGVVMAAGPVGAVFGTAGATAGAVATKTSVEMYNSARNARLHGAGVGALAARNRSRGFDKANAGYSAPSSPAGGPQAGGNSGGPKGWANPKTQAAAQKALGRTYSGG